MGYLKAIELLHKASTPKGFTASVHAEDNYQRVWTRDSAVCGLAALSTDDDDLKKTYQRSIETILQHQHPAGFIPSNVPVNNEGISYGNVVGRVDNHAWIVISACTFARLQKAEDWLLPFEKNIRKCFELMTAWEFNGRGLMYVPLSGDWADEYHHHGYVLYNQLLRLWALKCAAATFEDDYYAAEEKRIRTAIEKYFDGGEPYASQIKRMLPEKHPSYWLMGFNPAELHSQFDLQANALALFLKVGKSQKTLDVSAHITELLKNNALMLPSFSAPVREGDEAMNALKNNYAFRFRNHPYEFHNGGLWSVWNGFLAMAISPVDEAASIDLTRRITEACAQDDWSFNECHHGETGLPIGVPNCAWSAAGLILSVNHSFARQLYFFE